MFNWERPEIKKEKWVGQAIVAWLLKTDLNDIEITETSPGFVYSEMKAVSKSTGRVFTYTHKCDEGKVLWWHGIDGGNRTFTNKERKAFDDWCMKNNVENSYF